MIQKKIPAVFMRGGTSKAIVFKQADLPEDRALWDDIFLAAIGSPDPNGRQLNGMGGGISSLSKICIVGPPTRDDADIDFTFGQVAIGQGDTGKGQVGYNANCGNMSSAMGPFAVDESLVTADGDEALVRIHNTNTQKIIHARFALDDGLAAVDGDFDLPGVSGTGAPVKMEFRDPGGAGTGKLLPTGNVIDEIDVAGMGTVEASLVDAANPCVFVEATALGLTGTEGPADIDAMADVMARLEDIRAQAAVMMGLAKTPAKATKETPTIPFVGILGGPQDAKTLSAETIKAADGDLTARIVSNGNTHRALPLTGALCLATASRIDGTVAHRYARAPKSAEDDVRLMQPSGILPVSCSVVNFNGDWVAEYAGVYRTQRRLFEGNVLVPASRVKGS
ncbi:MAG: PrpF family protein [Rhodospirillales bacterium]|nr:PrpF family protein [Rhodospirillales bacterium]